MRSFRAENVSAFVRAVLDCEVEGARELLRRFVDRYPIAVTRNLLRAKRWVREHARGSERYVALVSGKAMDKCQQTRPSPVLNAYRVLLTRARQGMVICVPEGDAADPTRDSPFYDPTFHYLVDIGIPGLQ